MVHLDASLRQAEANRSEEQQESLRLANTQQLTIQSVHEQLERLHQQLLSCMYEADGACEHHYQAQKQAHDCLCEGELEAKMLRERCDMLRHSLAQVEVQLAIKTNQTQAVPVQAHQAWKQQERKLQHSVARVVHLEAQLVQLAHRPSLLRETPTSKASGVRTKRTQAYSKSGQYESGLKRHQLADCEQFLCHLASLTSAHKVETERIDSLVGERSTKSTSERSTKCTSAVGNGADVRAGHQCHNGTSNTLHFIGRGNTSHIAEHTKNMSLLSQERKHHEDTPSRITSSIYSTPTNHELSCFHSSPNPERSRECEGGAEELQQACSTCYTRDGCGESGGKTLEEETMAKREEDARFLILASGTNQRIGYNASLPPSPLKVLKERMRQKASRRDEEGQHTQVEPEDAQAAERWRAREKRRASREAIFERLRVLDSSSRHLDSMP